MIWMEGVSKSYYLGGTEVRALQDVALHVRAGEFLAVMGPSGSGKSTLLNIVGCLDGPSAGTYRLAGEEVAGLGGDMLARIRNRQLGFVFQTFNLLPRLNAVENVEVPLLYRGLPGRERRRLAEETLSLLGLGDRLRHFPTTLSGGEQQRVAIARAIVGQPAVLLADEPTGNLDSVRGKEIMDIFRDLNVKGMTVVTITHDAEVARYAHRTVRLRDGRLVDGRDDAGRLGQ